MAHNFESGFVLIEPAWHKHPDCKVLEVAPTDWEEARKLAGLDWDPFVEPVFDRTPTGVDEEGLPTYNYSQIGGFNQIKRSDTGRRLTIANDSYSLITNSDMGVIMNELMGHGHPIHTMGSLEDGRAVWALIELGHIEIPGDFSPTMRYAAILNRHDGQASLKVIQTNVRIVCSNTWHAADVRSDQSGHCFTFRHSPGWKVRLSEIAKKARKAIFEAKKQAELYRELAEELTQMPVTDEQIEAFLDDVIFPRHAEHELTKISLTNVLYARQKLRTAYASQTCAELAPTAYKLLQAAGEYYDHHRAYNNQDTYVGRTLIRPEKFKKRALGLAREASRGLL